MRTYIRLISYLKPYSGRLAAALLCMLPYAALSAVSLGMISPLMRVLFEGGSVPASVADPPRATQGLGGTITVANPAPKDARLLGWPQPLRAWAEGTLLNARPLVALERICVLIL